MKTQEGWLLYTLMAPLANKDCNCPIEKVLYVQYKIVMMTIKWLGQVLYSVPNV